MEKKEKKIYQSPIMTVYEIGRTQILAGSGQGETETLVEEDYINPLRGFCVACSTNTGSPEPREVEQASVRFHASFINRFTLY